jgi:hypothetical protein
MRIDVHDVKRDRACEKLRPISHYQKQRVQAVDRRATSNVEEMEGSLRHPVQLVYEHVCEKLSALLMAQPHRDDVG